MAPVPVGSGLKSARNPLQSTQLAFMAAYILRAIVGAGLSAYVFYWIREHKWV